MLPVPDRTTTRLSAPVRGRGGFTFRLSMLAYAHFQIPFVALATEEADISRANSVAPRDKGADGKDVEDLVRRRLTLWIHMCTACALRRRHHP